MEFEKVLMLTGIEQREGKNGSYILVHLLTEQGKGISLMYKGQPLNYTDLVKMKNHKFTFSIYFGQYTNVNILKIEPTKE